MYLEMIKILYSRLKIILLCIQSNTYTMANLCIDFV